MKESTIDAFRQWYIEKRLSKGTIDKYVTCIRYQDDIDFKKDSKELYNILHMNRWSLTSISSYLAYLRFLNDTIDDLSRKGVLCILIDYVFKKRQEAQRIYNSKDKKDKKERYITRKEYSILLDYIKNMKYKGYRYRNQGYKLLSEKERTENLLLVRLIYETAGRAEEVRNYTWNLVDLDRKIINVPASITKTKKDRTAQFSEDTKELLLRYRKQCGVTLKKEDRIFTSYGCYHKLLDYIHNSSLKALGFGITPHWLIISHMTHYVKKAVKESKENAGYIIGKYNMSKYVNHKELRTTENYIQGDIKNDFKRRRVI